MKTFSSICRDIYRKAVDVATMMPFIEKNTNTAPTITIIPPTPRPVVDMKR